MANGTVGRAPLSPATIGLVKSLRAQGLTVRAIVREAARRGVKISRGSAGEIVRGNYPAKRPSTARTSAGETRLSHPQRCPNGHLCAVMPCRTCGALDLVELEAQSNARLRAIGTRREA
jgi:hypothetical protein